jgi:hypothetical protein
LRGVAQALDPREERVFELALCLLHGRESFMTFMSLDER